MIKTSILILVISVLIFLFIEHINKRSHQLLVDIEHRGNDLIDKTEKRLREIVNDLLLKLDQQTVFLL
jgi:large-conductance mechanosensitive channel